MTRHTWAPARRAVATAGLLALVACSTEGSSGDGTVPPAPTATPTVTATPDAAEVTARTGIPQGAPGGGTGTADRDPATATAAAPTGWAEVVFTGDLMLARSIGDLVLAEGPEAPWAGIAQELAAADLRVGNLETAVGDVGEPEDKTYTFRAPEEAVDALVAGGFDVLTLANNHAYDYGADGLLETLRLVREAGIQPVGAGAHRDAAHAPAVVEAEGVRLAFLGYVSVPDDWTGYRNAAWAATAATPGVAWAEPEAIARDVAAVAPAVDHVVVLLHAGDEGSTLVNPVQLAAAEAAFGAGASALVGAHPHVLQGWSLDAGRLTAWSLGNTVFDGFTDPASLETALLTVTFSPQAIEDVRLVPVLLDDRGLPTALEADDAAGRSILDRVGTLPVPAPGHG